VPITQAPTSAASCTAIRPDRTRRAVDQDGRACDESGVHEQGLPCGEPEIAAAAGAACSTPAGSGARLRASTATYSASAPSRVQSVSPNTRWPTVRPVVPYPRSATTPDTS
jgi:hypothetical protein